MSTLFSSSSVFNAPFGPDSQWTRNGQLSSGNFTMYVQTSGQLGGTGYNQPLYWASSSDPTVTVTGAQNWKGQPYGPITVHIPAGAQPATGTDHPLSVVYNGMLYSFYNFTWTGAATAVASYTGIENTSGSGVIDAPSGQFDGSDYDFVVGTITQQDLNQAANDGSIDHMLRIDIPTNLAESYGSSAVGLSPYAGPQTMEDGFGPQVYSGTVPYGVTLGISKGTPEPADVKANEGANILWNTLETHGAMVRDTDGQGNAMVFSSDQNVNPNDPIIQGMDQYGAKIARYLQILTNQSSSMINGNPGSNWIAGGGSGGGSTGGGGPKPSPSGTVITRGHGSFVDAKGNTYTLTTGDVAMQNGRAMPGGGGTGAMEYYQGQVCAQAANTHDWYRWDGAYWRPISAPPTTPGGGGSTPGSSGGGIVITPGNGSFTDTAGNVYVLAQNGNAMENGAAIPGGGNTEKMAFYNGHVYGEDAATGNWYNWNQHQWSHASAPPSTSALLQSAMAAPDLAPSPPAAAVQPVTTPAIAAMPAALQSTEHPTIIAALH